MVGDERAVCVCGWVDGCGHSVDEREREGLRYHGQYSHGRPRI